MVDWAVQLALALQYLHGQTPPVLHLDVKPSNVLLFDVEAKLADFGISKVLANTCGTTKGFGATPNYSAPEQMDDDGVVTRATDVYGLGCVLWELVALRMAKYLAKV